jgi:hypothetical protein
MARQMHVIFCEENVKKCWKITFQHFLPFSSQQAKYMHLPRHGNVSTPVNTTYLPNNMCDSKSEEFKCIIYVPPSQQEESLYCTTQGKTRQKEGKTRQDKSRNRKARWYKLRQDKTKQTKKDKARYQNTKQYQFRQDKTTRIQDNG